MQQLVFQYINSDGYTYSCRCTYPFMYESAEKALVDFETILHDARKNNSFGEFKFAGIELCVHQFIDDDFINLPNIWTIDEWFKHECQNL